MISSTSWQPLICPHLKFESPLRVLFSGVAEHSTLGSQFRYLEYPTATSRSGRCLMLIHVRQALGGDHASILEIARSLHPQWFSELGIKDIARDLQVERGLIAEDDGKAVGFLIYCAKDNRTAELSWIGVRPELHRKGIGRALVNALEASLVQSGFQSLEVSTVAATTEDESYARTRTFYRAVGFSDVQIDMKWFSSGDDRLLLRKPLSSQARMPEVCRSRMTPEGVNGTTTGT